MGSKPSKVSEPKILTKRSDISDMEQLNDSVWLLSSPGTIPEVDVVFLHGLQLSDYEEAFWKTWLSRDGTELWPQAWLGKSLDKARILSVSYDSSARKAKNDMDLDSITEALIKDLILKDIPGVGQNCPVVLVGHSLGGIVIKELLLMCQQMIHECDASDEERIRKFLGNCRGVFYYSTPHGGSKLADYVAQIPFTGINEPIINLLTTLNKETGRINNSFSNSRKKLGIVTETIGESLDTSYKGLKMRVVEEASARHDTDSYYTLKDSDHFNVCRPRNNTWCGSFSNLHGFVTNKVLAKTATREQVLPPTNN